MVYITGDTHREFDRIEEFCNEYETTGNDILIILGDVGINYFLDESDDEIKEELTKFPITLFCIHGNHEERPYLISTYFEKMWHGGLVYYEEEYPNIIFAADGEIYDFDGNKAIAIGGAYSLDKNRRLVAKAPWFESEQPDERIKEYVVYKLEEAGRRVDFVLSHTGPLKYLPKDVFLPGYDQSSIDRSTEKWLDSIEDNLDYDLWYFGHFHCDRIVGKAVILFDSIEELE